MIEAKARTLRTLNLTSIGPRTHQHAYADGGDANSTGSGGSGSGTQSGNASVGQSYDATGQSNTNDTMIIQTNLAIIVGVGSEQSIEQDNSIHNNIDQSNNTPSCAVTAV